MVNCREPEASVCDSDGEVVGQESTIFAIFEFISALSESRRLQRLLPPILPDLLYHLIAHMQITEEQVGAQFLSYPLPHQWSKGASPLLSIYCCV